MVKQNIVSTQAWRIRLLAGVFFLCFGLIVVRLWVLQVVRGGYYAEAAKDQQAGVLSIQSGRGDIKVRAAEGEILPIATSVKSYLVYVSPREIADAAITAVQLASALGLDPAEVEAKISDQSKTYAPLKHQITDAEKQAVKSLKIRGVYLASERLRYYPEGALFAHITGHVGFLADSGADKVGLYGLERQYNQLLSGKEGQTPKELKFSLRSFLGLDVLLQESRSQDLLLTLEKPIQIQAQQILQQAVKDHGASGGCLLVMDPGSGSILAMSSQPEYDPNQSGRIEDVRTFQNTCTENYEPGSVFKAVTMAAGLDSGAVRPEMTYTDTGSVTVDGYTIRNAEEKTYGVQTMEQVLEKSLNTGVIFVENKIGHKNFLKYVQDFGFGQPSGLDLPESKGSLDNLATNVNVNYDTASFGQGISVTPVQLARAYATIAAGGKRLEPHLVRGIISSSGKETSLVFPPPTQVISAATAKALAGMLVGVVERGHGKRARVPGYYIAGKTGTAQVARQDGRGYEDNKNIGTFAGFAPADNPRFVIVVRIDYPKNVKFAESTAAPAFGQMARFLLPYLHIMPNRPLK